MKFNCPHCDQRISTNGEIIEGKCPSCGVDVQTPPVSIQKSTAGFIIIEFLKCLMLISILGMLIFMWLRPVNLSSIGLKIDAVNSSILKSQGARFQIYETEWDIAGGLQNHTKFAVLIDTQTGQTWRLKFRGAIADGMNQFEKENPAYWLDLPKAEAVK